MQYLTYDEYVSLGGELDLAAFMRSVDRVCGFLARETHKRVDSMRDIPQEVKACCRDLLDYVAAFTNDGGVTSKSQSAGGVSESVTYKAMGERVTEMQEIIYDYLASVTDDFYTPLLYRGCKR